MEHKVNSDYILSVLARHGKTPTIERFVREVLQGNIKYTGQEAWDRVVKYYTKSQRGIIRARKIRTDVNTLRLEAKHMAIGYTPS